MRIVAFWGKMVGKSVAVLINGSLRLQIPLVRNRADILQCLQFIIRSAFSLRSQAPMLVTNVHLNGGVLYPTGSPQCIAKDSSTSFQSHNSPPCLDEILRCIFSNFSSRQCFKYTRLYTWRTKLWVFRGRKQKVITLQIMYSYIPTFKNINFVLLFPENVIL